MNKLTFEELVVLKAYLEVVMKKNHEIFTESYCEELNVQLGNIIGKLKMQSDEICIRYYKKDHS